jgi:hypothetical protein
LLPRQFTKSVSATGVNNIPEDEFDKSAGDAKLPTVTELAARGTKSKPKPLIDP